MSDLFVCRDLVAQYVLTEFFDWLPPDVSYVEWFFRYDPRRDRPVYLGSRVLDWDDDQIAVDLSGWKDACYELMRLVDPEARNHPSLVKYLRAAMQGSGCEVVRFGYQMPEYSEGYDVEDEDETEQ